MLNEMVASSTLETVVFEFAAYKVLTSIILMMFESIDPTSWLEELPPKDTQKNVKQCFSKFTTELPL